MKLTFLMYYLRSASIRITQSLNLLSLKKIVGAHVQEISNQSYSYVIHDVEWPQKRPENFGKDSMLTTNTESLMGTGCTKLVTISKKYSTWETRLLHTTDRRSYLFYLLAPLLMTTSDANITLAIASYSNLIFVKSQHKLTKMHWSANPCHI